jgi:leucyl aminopeptidase
VADAAQATVEGVLMGAYQFREHKAKPENGKTLQDLLLVEYDAAKMDEVTTGAQTGQAIANGVNFARDLISRAPNVLNPTTLTQYAQDMAARTGLVCTVLTEKEIAEQKMGGILAVSQGSANPPRFVVLEHAPSNSGQQPITNNQSTHNPPLVFVGKGVTFDTGGISLKDPGGMEAMKGDMGGAAAVIGAMRAVAELKLPRRVIGLVPMVENMPSDRSYRPSDVITMMSGLTVEIISTDAEGRMILADALHYAKQYKPAGVVDLATLTGACVVALGEGIAAGLFSNNDDWAQQVLGAAGIAGERLWQLPLYPEYGDKIRSDFAEIKNSGGRTGGVGTSAYFLKRFVEEGDKSDAYPWAHIDMAGMAFSSETKGYQPKGAVGYGVRLLVALARSL